MRKALVHAVQIMAALIVVALILPTNLQSYAQVTCPARLTDGVAGPDSIKLSFMNKGKIAIRQLILSCSPPLNQKTPGGVCHTEGGIFYPGTEYFMDIPYPGANRHPVVISLKAAVLVGGVIWNSTPAEACRTLRVLKKK
jgi:hypothetical protein